ncbi:hypothetical protein ACSBR1_030903 [Camellia fascicularis]
MLTASGSVSSKIWWLNLLKMVERDRNLLNAKLLEFENLLRNPYAVPQNPSIATQTAFPGATPIVSSMTAQNSNPPSVSSFSQLGPLLLQIMLSGSTQISSQTTSVFETNNSPFGSSGSFGGQLRNQSFGSSFASNAASCSNGAVSAERNPFFTSAVSPQVPSSASFQSSILPNGPNSASTAVEQLSVNVDTIDNRTRKNGAVDDAIWLKEEWNPGENQACKWLKYEHIRIGNHCQQKSNLGFMGGDNSLELYGKTFN